MDLFFDVLLLVHVAAGGLGLVVFWIPVATRKGGKSHKRFGSIFKWCAYVVLAAAATSVVVRLSTALAEGTGPRDAPSQFGFLIFLGYLAAVTWVVIRHGVQVLKHKRDLTELNRPLDRGLAYFAMFASVVLIAYTLAYAPPNRLVLFSLSPLGILGGKGILDAITGKVNERNQWLLEHLGAMLGAGIAFHTAFAVFGMSRLFDLGITGWMAVIPWVAPAAIGVPATALWARKYRRPGSSAPQPATT